MPTIRWSRIHQRGPASCAGSPSRSAPQAEQRLLEPGPECEGAGGTRCTFQRQTEQRTDALGRGGWQLPPWPRQSCSSGWVLALGLKHSPFQPHASGSPLPGVHSASPATGVEKVLCHCGGEPERVRCCRPTCRPSCPRHGRMAPRRISCHFAIHHCRIEPGN